jgi:hypothetical protein
VTDFCHAAKIAAPQTYPQVGHDRHKRKEALFEIAAPSYDGASQTGFRNHEQDAGKLVTCHPEAKRGICFFQDPRNTICPATLPKHRAPF